MKEIKMSQENAAIGTSSVEQVARALKAPAEPTDLTALFYESEALTYFEKTVSLDISDLYVEFLPLLAPNSRILDLGCGSGRDLLAFIQRGFQAVGVDASAALVQQAAAHSGAPCVQCRFEELSYLAEFDAVWACASLLHVTKDAFAKALSRVYATLVPGGIFYLSMKSGVGTASGKDGRFYAYFEAPELQEYLTRAGFSLVKAWSTSSVLPGDATEWRNVVVRKT